MSESDDEKGDVMLERDLRRRMREPDDDPLKLLRERSAELEAKRETLRRMREGE